MSAFFKGVHFASLMMRCCDATALAQALAFVMDVDELVADVILTERLRSTLGKLEPLSCGKILRREVKCVPAKDRSWEVLVGISGTIFLLLF